MEITTSVLPPLLSRHEHPVLKPGSLDAATTRALGDLLKQGTPPATLRAYEHGLRYWQAWHTLRYGIPLPLPSAPMQVSAILQFLADHVPRTVEDGSTIEALLPAWADQALVAVGVKRQPGLLAHNTVAQRLAIISAVHARLSLPNPAADGQVRALMAAAQVAVRNQGRSAQPAAVVTPDVLNQLLETCDDTPVGDRDRALLSLIYHSGGRRRSEIQWLGIEDCRRHDEGYVLTFRRVKAKASNEVLRVPLVAEPARALDRWLARLDEAGRKTGPVFVAVRGQNKVHMGTQGITGHAVAAILKRRLRAAGISEHYTPHGMRAGYITDRLDRGESYAAVMAMTAHTDPRTLEKHYHRPQDILGNSAAAPTPGSKDA